MKIKDWDAGKFLSFIKVDGYCIVEEVFDAESVNVIREFTQYTIEKEAKYHGTKNYPFYGAIQACPMYGGVFLSLLENRNLIEPFNLLMGEGCIIWTYISTSMPPHNKNFATRIHVDRPRFFPNYMECAGSLIFLDDVNDENGSTWVMPGSHTNPNEPSEKEFYNTAIRLKASAGSVFYFNTRLWHAGGFNNTDQWRHALGIGVVRPYLKQKFDFPKMLQDHGIITDELSGYVKQKLGFFAIPPSTLDEYWGPMEKRSYREKSEWDIAKLGY